MHAPLVGLTALDVIHALGHEPGTTRKTTSANYAMSAGGPATNVAVTVAALESLRPIPSYIPASSITLFSAVEEGTIAGILAADFKRSGVSVFDVSITDSPVSAPAISSIIEHPGGRMVASTNARISVDTERGGALLAEALDEMGSPDMVFVDGHNPSLTNLILDAGVAPEGGVGEDPFACLEEKPSHLQVLDGGSWKEWFVPLLSLVDMATVSADFCPLLLERLEIHSVTGFLRGFGTTRVMRTRGPEPVEWVWDERQDTTAADEVEALSTLNAGGIFHGAFVWALGILHEEGREILEDPSRPTAFVARIAGVSTSMFSTRSWRNDPRVVEAVEEFLSSSEIEDLRRGSAPKQAWSRGSTPGGVWRGWIRMDPYPVPPGSIRFHAWYHLERRDRD